MFLRGFIPAYLAIWMSVPACAQAQAPAPTAETLYRGYCGNCHGATGEGARGPALAGVRLKRASTEAAFVKIVQQGIPDTGMPPSRLPAGDVSRIYGYLANLAVQRGANSGDAARGQSILRGKGGCLRCHIVAGEGGRLGPELTTIGQRLGPAGLRTALVDPASTGRDNFAQYRLVIPMPDNFQIVRVRLRDGRQVRGVRMNEDPFSIQLRDFDDRLHAFLKNDVEELVRETGSSPMPSYRGTLSDAEIEDVVAYLATLGTMP